MPRKGENIYYRKDKRWEGRYPIGMKEDGKVKYGYVYGKSYSEVKARLIQYKAAVKKNIEYNPEFYNRRTFGNMA